MKKGIIAVLLLCYCGNMLKAQWQQSGLSGKSLYALASDGTNIFAAAFNNGVYLSVNNGDNWTPVNNGLPSMNFDRFISSIAISGTNIYAATAGSAATGIYLSTDNGSNWTAVNNGLTTLKVTSLAVGGSNIFAGTNGGGVFFSSNNGSSWIAVNTGLTNNTVSSLAINGSNIFAGTATGVFLSTNNGGSWTEVSSGLTNKNIYCLTVSGSDIFAGTNGSGVFRSTNNGSSWSAVNTDMASSKVFSIAIKGTTLLAGSDNGTYVSQNNGVNWTLENSGLMSVYVTSLMISGTNAFAGIDLNGVWKRPLNDFVGIEENNEDTHLMLYPNPFSSFTTLRSSKAFSDATLTVYNLMGQQVKQIRNISGQSIRLNRDNLPCGMYLLRLTEDDSLFVSEKVLLTDN